MMELEGQLTPLDPMTCATEPFVAVVKFVDFLVPSFVECVTRLEVLPPFFFALLAPVAWLLRSLIVALSDLGSSAVARGRAGGMRVAWRVVYGLVRSNYAQVLFQELHGDYSAIVSKQRRLLRR